MRVWRSKNLSAVAFAFRLAAVCFGVFGYWEVRLRSSQA